MGMPQHQLVGQGRATGIPSDSPKTGRRNVLVLAYAFPPRLSSGVFRTAKFVQYLPDYGWQPIVVTVPEGVHQVKDRHLAALVAGHCQVYEAYIPRALARIAEGSGRIAEGTAPRRGWTRLVKSLGRRNILLIPDLVISWAPFALAKAVRLHRRFAFSVVFASAPPFSTSLIAAWIGMLLRRPVVLDFRDAWTLLPYSSTVKSRLRRGLERRLERWALGRAAGVVFTNDHVAQDYVRTYPFLRGRTSVITNGFDPADFTRAPAISFQRPTLLHIGMADEKRGRSPLVLFEALRELLREDPGWASRVSLRFTGAVGQAYVQAARGMNLDGIVEFEPEVPYLESLARQKAAAGLLLIATDPSEIPGKAFEYVGARRPIYLLGHPGGATAEMLARVSRLRIGPLADPPRAKEEFKDFLRQIARPGALPVDGEMLDQDASRRTLTRPALTERLSQLLDAVAEKGRLGSVP